MRPVKKLQMKSKNKSPPVRRGRPPKGALDIEESTIVETALELSRILSLTEISIVRVAKEMGITPASIHYYVKARHKLTIAITDKWFAGLLAKWPPTDRDWRDNIHSIAHTIYQHCIAYPGMASHLATQNRFRLALSIEKPDDAPHMVRFLDQFFAAILRSGLTGKPAAMFAFELSQFIHTAANASASHQIPGEQSKFRQLLQQLDKERFPAIAALRNDYVRLSGDESFDSGLQHVINGYGAKLT